MAKKVLIAGASGLIGSRLTEIFLRKGKEVVHLGRTRKSTSVPSFTWNIEQGTIDPRALSGVEGIVNLAGAGVAERRWSATRKKEILNSRLRSTDILHKALRGGQHQVRSYISASAIGYYGLGKDEGIITEDNPPGGDFLAQVVTQWEAEAEKMNSLNVRVVKLRTGIVLSERGGALKSMVAPIQFGFGAALGNGKQYVSWIHLDDLCEMYASAVEDDDMVGSYNAVTENPVTNAELTKVIAKVLKKPLWLPPVPGFVLRCMLGELADIVLHGSKISPERILNTGFRFQFPDLETALRNLYKS